MTNFTNALMSDYSTFADEYANADRKGKAALRVSLDNSIRETMAAVSAAMVERDADRAVSHSERYIELVALRESVIGGGSDKSDTTPDYAEIVAKHIASVEIALDALKSGIVDNLPDGVELDFDAIADNAAKLFDDAEFLRSDQVARMVTNLTNVKFGTRRAMVGERGENGSIASHIAEWAEAHESGHSATSGEIAKFPSETYAALGRRPSAGAITVHLFPASGDPYEHADVTGVRPTLVGLNGFKGAIVL